MNDPRTGSSPVFDLPDRLSGKREPALIASDERHFADIGDCLAQTVTDLTSRLGAVRRQTARAGQEVLERDQEVHRLTARLRVLRRFGLDLCLGRMVTPTGATYVGRLGLSDRTGRRLLLDWRSPAAEPFFGATHARSMGLVSRRRYRWARGRITDYWDEVFDLTGLEGHAALDDQSAFIASLGSSRSARMRDVLSTIAADQDAIIRAGSRGALVVDGGPGTGKTVVALHRAAYLVYSDPRLGHDGAHRRGDVLFVGPHQPYLDYVADVLPSLGEEGVQTCTLRDLVPGGRTQPTEADPEVARLKSTAALVAAIEPAVALYEEPPAAGLSVSTPWDDVWLHPADWAEAFDAVEPGTPHNEAVDAVREALLAIVADRHPPDVPLDDLRKSLRQNEDLASALRRAWPLLDPAELVGDLWSVPAYLRRCAPGLSVAEVRRLQRAEGSPWTVSDLPLLDAARRRLGDASASRRRERRSAELAAERERRAAVVDDLIASDDSEMLVMSMLRGADLQNALDDASPAASVDELAGPFAHIVVDEAQELTDAEWQMLLARCPSRSFTVVGDRAQARHGFTGSWTTRLERAGLDRVSVSSLTVNYRTPSEVMAEAAPVILSVLPDANVPTSVRSSGLPVVRGAVSSLESVLRDWLEAHDEGVACVIGPPSVPAGFTPPPRVRALSPELAKGLEFDLVVLVDVEPPGAGTGPAVDTGPGVNPGVEAAVDRYVAMTRATQQLVVLSDS